MPQSWKVLHEINTNREPFSHDQSTLVGQNLWLEFSKVGFIYPEQVEGNKLFVLQTLIQDGQ